MLSKWRFYAPNKAYKLQEETGILQKNIQNEGTFFVLFFLQKTLFFAACQPPYEGLPPAGARGDGGPDVTPPGAEYSYTQALDMARRASVSGSAPGGGGRFQKKTGAVRKLTAPAFRTFRRACR